MKIAYPVVMTQGKTHIIASIPDFDIDTQGKDFADAMEMARDAIGIMGIDMEDDGEALPNPSALSEVQAKAQGSVVTFVDVDFAEYRRKNDTRAARTNCTIPTWLKQEAEKAGVNFSAVLQEALKAELRITH